MQFDKFQQRNRRRYYRIDRFFLVVFPLMFVGFNVGYWIYYFYFNPMKEVNAKFSHEEEDGTVTGDDLLVSSTIPPEITQDSNNDK